MTRADLEALAETYEMEGVRIARIALDSRGVCRADAETAQSCFIIARELRALAKGTEQ